MADKPIAGTDRHSLPQKCIYVARLIASLALSRRLHCHCTVPSTALHCTALHCTSIVLCPPLPCQALYCTAMPSIALQCPPLYYHALHCTAMPSTALQCPPLHCPALHCNADIMFWVRYCIRKTITSNILKTTICIKEQQRLLLPYVYCSNVVLSTCCFSYDIIHNQSRVQTHVYVMYIYFYYSYWAFNKCWWCYAKLIKKMERTHVYTFSNNHHVPLALTITISN